MRRTGSLAKQHWPACNAVRLTTRNHKTSFISKSSHWGPQSRTFSSSRITRDEGKAPSNEKTVPITFVNKDGSTIEVNAVVGDSILTVAHANNIDLEGACEGSLACSTCHVILEPEWYNKLPSPVEEEEDMLDLAFALTETSRLGCQIIVTEAMTGMVLKLPSATRNMAVDGFKPKPH